MKIEHLAIWAKNLEATRKFYEHYFGARTGNRYENVKKNFTSYFLQFQSGSRLELMHRPQLQEAMGQQTERLGLAHFAISVGSKEKVDSLTTILRSDGHTVVGEPRTTGDGYYESVVLDPEGNRIEITI